MHDFIGDQWRECIRLALEAYNAGSYGIAAVIVDGQGNLVAKGRNQLKDDLESCSAIRMTTIAHAEINALNNLPLTRQRERDLVLYTTVEPCPMCLGAVAMSRIKRIIIGSADPYAGSVRLLEQDPFLAQRGITPVFEQGDVEKICFALHYLSLKRALKPSHAIFDKMSIRYPTHTEKLNVLIETSQLSFEESLDEARLMELLIRN